MVKLQLGIADTLSLPMLMCYRLSMVKLQLGNCPAHEKHDACYRLSMVKLQQSMIPDIKSQLQALPLEHGKVATLGLKPSVSVLKA